METVTRHEQIVRAVERAIASVSAGEVSPGAGGVFELAYPFVAAEVPNATQGEVRAAFGSLWGISDDARAFHEHVLAVCERHSPGETETIKEVLQRASLSGDLEAGYLLSLVKE